MVLSKQIGPSSRILDDGSGFLVGLWICTVLGEGATNAMRLREEHEKLKSPHDSNSFPINLCPLRSKGPTHFDSR